MASESLNRIVPVGSQPLDQSDAQKRAEAIHVFAYIAPEFKDLPLVRRVYFGTSEGGSNFSNLVTIREDLEDGDITVLAFHSHAKPPVGNDDDGGTVLRLNETMTRWLVENLTAMLNSKSVPQG